jgi:prepilin-type N-terminal cleavage/methylation domain-containing protein
MNHSLPQSPRTHSRRRYAPRGFTLTELLVALALVAVLLVGISSVFRLTSNAIGAGTALGDAIRAHRAIGNQLSLDFLGYSATANIAEPDDNSGILPIGEPNTGNNNRQPAIIIYSTHRPSFLSPEAETANTEIRRRIDTLSFFTRGTFTRQTGEGTKFSDSFKSTYAWVWYGHLRVFNSVLANVNLTAGYDAPGVKSAVAGSQANNYYARDWTLGRGAMLLSDYNRPNNTIVDSAGNLITYVTRAWTSPTTDSNALSPLNYGSSANQGGSIIQQVGTDVAATTPSQFRARLAFLADPAGDPTANTQPFVGSRLDDWYEFVFGSDTRRFWANPFAAQLTDASNATAVQDYGRALSRRSQLLQRGVTQFTVEFAGDFAPADGEVDFNTVNGVRQIRWYGFPRDVDGDGDADDSSVDVLPVSSYTAGTYLAVNGNNYSGFEKELPTPTNATYTAAQLIAIDDDAEYRVAFGPHEFDASWDAANTGEPQIYPALIRITVDVVDPLSRLGEPVTQEYIFPVRR